MGRRSPLGIDGVSVDWRYEDGRATSIRIRVKDEANKYEGKVFQVVSWDREGKPRMPLEAERWAKSKRADFLSGRDIAGKCDFQSEAMLYAERLRADGKNPGYAKLVETVAGGLLVVGATDMKAKDFAVRVSKWLSGLKPNWAFAEDYQFRRTGGAPLSASTKLKYLTMIRAVVAQAVRGRRLAFDPLAELRRPKVDRKLKPIFTLKELRVIVSDDSKMNRNRLRVQAIDEVKRAKGSTKKVAATLGVHVSTVHNRINSELIEDGWWLLACLLVYTGMRSGEAAHLQWEDILWRQDRIKLVLREGGTIKGRKERYVPLEPELVELLKPIAKTVGPIIEDEALRESGSVLLNRERKVGSNDYTKGFRRYLARIGIDDAGRTVHSLRHSYISMKIARNDMNLDRLRKSVGHEDIKTTQGYSEASQMFEAEVDKWPDSTLWLRREFKAVDKAVKHV